MATRTAARRRDQEAARRAAYPRKPPAGGGAGPAIGARGRRPAQVLLALPRLEDELGLRRASFSEPPEPWRLPFALVVLVLAGNVPSLGPLLGGVAVPLGLGCNPELPVPPTRPVWRVFESDLLNCKLKEKPALVSLTTLTRGPS